jgi:hypothetical protein
VFPARSELNLKYYLDEFQASDDCLPLLWIKSTPYRKLFQIKFAVLNTIYNI